MQGHTKMEKFNQVFKSQTTANRQQQTQIFRVQYIHLNDYNGNLPEHAHT